jgi:hypothetical protein
MYFFGRIIDRLKIVFPDDYKNYLYLFGIKLRFIYFMRKVTSGVIDDSELLGYYHKIRTPIYISLISWCLGLVAIATSFIKSILN